MKRKSRCTPNGASAEDYEAMRTNPGPLPYLQQALAFATFEPGIYEVVETYSATNSERVNAVCG
jgi:hypothetical protein